MFAGIGEDINRYEHRLYYAKNDPIAAVDCCGWSLLSTFAVDFYCQLVLLWTTTIDFSCRLLLLICAVDFCAVKFYYRPLEWRDVMLPSEWRLLMKLEVVSAVWFYAEWYLGPKQCVIHVCFAELTRDNHVMQCGTTNDQHGVNEGAAALSAKYLSGIVARSTVAIKTSTKWCDKRHQMTDG